MKRLVMLLAALVVAVEVQGATVVLTGGKRLEVAKYSLNGSYVTVEYANGRRESYPLSAVDLGATEAAKGEKTSPAKPAAEAGPHSPFLGAKSSGGSGALLVTDADVKHIEKGDEEAASEDKEEQPEDSGNQVVLVSYDKKLAAKGQWDITATVANLGKSPVQGVSALVRVLDLGGKPLASGSGVLNGKLEAGKQGTITARVIMEGEPAQVAVDLSWQEIRPVPTPAAPKAQTPVPMGAAAKPEATALPNNPSPMAVQTNPMSLVPPTSVGTAPQAPPQEPPTPK